MSGMREHAIMERAAGGTVTGVLYGSLWGGAEATLGFLLHAASRFIPGGSLAGFIMFPIGVFFMISAYRATGSKAAIGVTALTAACIKISSAFAVPWIFVVNPTMAILSQGLILWGGVAIAGEKRILGTISGAAAVSVLWRAAFITAVVVLPVQKGILMKGSETIFRFLLVESAVNAAILFSAASLVSAAGFRRASPAPRLYPGPAGLFTAGSVFLGTLLVQILLS